jgi:hypothetical protein
MFSYCYYMREGSGHGSRAGYGSIPLTSGSGRPINMWIWWIRIRIQNTGLRENSLGDGKHGLSEMFFNYIVHNSGLL